MAISTTKMLATLLLFFISIISHAQQQLVNINGTNFNVYVHGIEDRKPNSPVVIFENGMGVDLSNWNKVIHQIEEFVPVFAYDRAGIGKSDKDFIMPTIDKVATNLHEILNKLNIPPPYILVGHSLGGVYIRSFAGYYPDEIAGLVFVDPADFTETKKDWNDIFRVMNLPEKKIDEMLQNRLYQPNPPIDSLRFGAMSERLILNNLRKTDFAEITSMPLPNVPIYFFVGGKFEVPLAQRSKDFDQEAFFHIKNNSNMERWKKLIYASSKGGAIIYLTNAGHYIQNDEPKLMIGIIKNLVESLKE
ncbi:MAG: alpha/beta hydrolase [Saprospiraceae bacterium]|nr:alpha/beta hydrolase [Saprospiraceae bacterium]